MIKTIETVLLVVCVLYWAMPVFEYNYNKLYAKPALPGIRYDDLALKRCLNGSDWTLHGWWPEYDKKHWPSWCNKTLYAEFNMSYIDDNLLSLMNRYWSVCPGWSISNEDLWRHEWEKHATCIEGETMVHYYGHTIEAFLSGLSNGFYGCCVYEKNECLIPYSRNRTIVKWLGRC